MPSTCGTRQGCRVRHKTSCRTPQSTPDGWGRRIDSTTRASAHMSCGSPAGLSTPPFQCLLTSFGTDPSCYGPCLNCLQLLPPSGLSFGPTQGRKFGGCSAPPWAVHPGAGFYPSVRQEDGNTCSSPVASRAAGVLFTGEKKTLYVVQSNSFCEMEHSCLGYAFANVYS